MPIHILADIYAYYLHTDTHTETSVHTDTQKYKSIATRSNTDVHACIQRQRDMYTDSQSHKVKNCDFMVSMADSG